ncbi:MAG: hypothetical protein IPK82_00545 [Polyangiaceae bacterium]|nr:hypothetical protein [Polyangiaceae bacterium]
MAISEEWDEVDEAFKRLDHYGVLHPTLAAMRKLTDIVRQDSAFVDAHPSVSLASLALGLDHTRRCVVVAWNEDGSYEIGFVDPGEEFSEVTTASEHDVVEVVREYFQKLRENRSPTING